MSTGNDKGPAAPTPLAPVDWRNAFARKVCLEPDWTKVAHAALGSAILAGLVGGAVYMIGSAIEADIRAETARRASAQALADECGRIADEIDRENGVSDDDDDDEPRNADDAHATDPGNADDEKEPAHVVDEKTAHASAILGVGSNASEDEIRAALRSHLSASRLHPDHGGNGEEAKLLIAAKNLLIERARAVRS